MMVMAPETRIHQADQQISVGLRFLVSTVVMNMSAAQHFTRLPIYSAALVQTARFSFVNHS